MIENFDEILYGPVFDMWAVDASLKSARGGAAVAIRAIDMTQGLNLTDTSGSNSMSSLIEQTVRPAASVRASELAERAIAIADLDGGEITFNGKKWTIDTHIMNPSPTGENTGEVLLILVGEQ